MWAVLRDTQAWKSHGKPLTEMTLCTLTDKYCDENGHVVKESLKKCNELSISH